ncbi:MAG: aminotransferase class V-fold PLP-dependent enzyme, partial [Planctomycetota bacterium]
MKIATPEIYLDANATTQVLPAAAQAAQNAMETLFGNPSSSHVTGLRARYILEETRNLARAALGVERGRIIFTSGATEAIQTAVLSALCHLARENNARPLLLYGATEHKAVPEALRHWNAILGIGADVVEIPVDERGIIDCEFLREHAPGAGMVCTMAVNNETGTVQPLREIEEALRSSNPDALWLVDSVQALAKVDLALGDTTIDYAPISGHKLYAPKGIGVLYVREGAPFQPLIAGGGQESGFRSGTENLPGVAALGAVLRTLLDENDGTFKDHETLTSYREQLVASLRDAFPRIEFNAPFDCTVPTTINFSVGGFASKEILDLFDAAEIRVSSGSACGSGTTQSYVLDAMGVPAWQSRAAIRLSFGPASSAESIRAACERIRVAGESLRHSCLTIRSDLDATQIAKQDGLFQLKKGNACTWIYACASSKTCLIVDPISELSDRVEKFVECQGYEIAAILDTHHHVDHDSCRSMLLEVLSRFTRASARDCDDLGWPNEADGIVLLGDGSPAEFLQLSEDQIVTRSALPGHTVDGRVYLLGRPHSGAMEGGDVEFAFSGDTVLIGGIGRTDFEVSSSRMLYDSLRRLPALIGDDTVICPSHDYREDFVSTLGTEKRNNEFLSRIVDAETPLDFETFDREKTQLDGELDDENSNELICGAVRRDFDIGSSIDVKPTEFARFFK